MFSLGGWMATRAVRLRNGWLENTSVQWVEMLESVRRIDQKA